MRVLIIDAAWYGGGAETIARELYSYLEGKGHTVKYAFARGDIPKDVKSIKLGNKVDVLAQAFIARVFDSAGFGYKKISRELIEEIETFKPDIVSMHNLSGYFINIELLFKYLQKKKISTIWTFHDCWGFTGHCVFFDVVNCNKWRSGCGNCPAKKEYPSCYVFDRSKSNYIKKKELLEGWNDLQIVTPSEWLANIAKQTYLKNKHINVINNGIDLDVFKPINSNLRERYDLDKKIIILGVASRWDLRKGLDCFIKLNGLIDQSLMKIVLIGLTEKQIKCLPSGIIAIPRTNSVEELVEWYSVADIFAFPSLSDNFPTVILEALACGTPVVTYDTGGCWESVGEECGVLVEEKTAEGMMRAITRCLDKKIDSNICVNKASRYTKTEKYQEYEKLFQEILKRRKFYDFS